LESSNLRYFYSLHLSYAAWYSAVGEHCTFSLCLSLSHGRAEPCAALVLVPSGALEETEVPRFVDRRHGDLIWELH
jgi:hypothetical protein